MTSRDERKRRPCVLTVEQAARRYGFSRRQLQARVALGGFPGAYQEATDEGEVWLIPLRTFRALGYRPVRRRKTRDGGSRRDLARSSAAF